MAHPKRQRRWTRRLIVLGVVVCALLAVYIVLTRTAVTRLIACSLLSRTIGADVTAKSVEVLSDGRILVADAVVRAKGVEGVGGEALRVKSIEVDPSWPSLLRGGTHVHSVIIDEPIIRFSQCTEDGTVNIAAFKLPERGQGAVKPPVVLVRKGVVELGEHSKDGRHYTALRRIEVHGSVQRSEDNSGDSIVSFTQTADSRGGTPLEITGRVGKGGLALSLDGLALSEWPVETVPTPLRPAFKNLGLVGKVGRTTFTYAPDGTLEAAIALMDVGINLPIEPQPEEDAQGNLIPLPPDQIGRRLRIEKVNGSLRLRNNGLAGELSGVVEDLPYEVQLDIKGTKENAPFKVVLTSRDFEMTKNPQILRFAPGIAQRRLAQFSYPTGIVDAVVTITRAEGVGDAPGALSVSGVIKLKDGSAAFERFPYRFDRMHGEWRFSDDEIRFIDVQGVAPSGARILATGVIAPPTSEAKVDIRVRVTDLPVDETLEEALGKRRKITEALFNRPRYLELVEQGLVLSPEKWRDLRLRLFALEAGDEPDHPDEPDQLRAQLERPVFVLGGRADVDVHITREPGPEGEWFDEIDIRVHDAGLVPEKFPYPLYASNLRILKENEIATLSGGTYRGIFGGTASVEALVDLKKIEDVRGEFVPDITIRASDVPIENLLLNAVPQGSGAISPRALLAELRPSGTLEHAAIQVGMTADDDVGYDIDLRLKEGAAAPASLSGEQRAALRAVSGRVFVSEERLNLDLAGELRRTGHEPAAPASIRAEVSLLGDQTAGTTAAESREPIHAEVEVKRADLATHAEDFVRLIAPDAAAQIAQRRADHAPEGSADLRVQVFRDAATPLRTVVEAAEPKASFTVHASRVTLEESTGAASLTIGGGLDTPRVEFKNLSASLKGGESDRPGHTPPRNAGTITLNGWIRADAAPDPDSRLRVVVKDGLIDSWLVRTVAQGLGDDAVRLLDEHQPRGDFDLAVLLAPQRTGEALRWAPTGTIVPRSLAFFSSGGPVLFPKIIGTVELTPEGGRFRDLRLLAPDWNVLASGSWLRDTAGLAAETRLALESDGFPQDLSAALPAALTDVLDQLDFSPQGAVTIPSAELAFHLPGTGGLGVRGSGRAELANTSLDIGTPLLDADAVIDWSFDRTHTNQSPSYELKILASRARLYDVALTNARALVASGPLGEVLVPMFSADCHGGRVAGQAALFPGEPREFRVEARASDVRFASVLADLSDKAKMEALGDDAAAAQRPDPGAPDESRGRLDAEFSLAGLAGRPSSRRGRGTATIGGERVLNIPVAVALTRLTNLELPVNERLDYARANFFLQGNRLSFEEVLLSSSSVGFYGFGTADLPDLTLDLRFRARNKLRIPLVSTLVEGIRNELFTAEVRGTPAKPEVKLVTLGGTARLIRDAFGERADEQTLQLDRIEAAARRQRQQPAAIWSKPAAAIEPVP